MGKVYGFDISENNKNIDFKQAVEDGYKFAIIRIGYGQGNEDSKFREYANQALDAGLKIGGYWFSYALNAEMGRKEGEYCRQIVDDWGGVMELPIYHDQESDKWRDANGLDYSSITQQTINFADELGLNCGIYSYYSWAVDGNVDVDYLKNYMPFWLAQYNVQADLPCDIWQYTDKGQIGDAYPIDLNVYTE